jgi:hypothetical protein
MKKITPWRIGKGKAFLLALLTILVILIVMISIEENTTYYHGEVWGGLNVDGHVSARDTFNEREYGITGFDLNNDSLIFEFNEIDRICVRIRAGLNSTEVFYNLTEKHFAIKNERGFVFCKLMNANIEYNLSEFFGESMENSRYSLFTNFSSINGSAFIKHRNDTEFDIWTSDITLLINGLSLDFPAVNIILLTDENIPLRILGQGVYLLRFFPVFIIKGTLIIQDFLETSQTGLKVSTKKELKINHNTIIIKTEQEPDYWSDDSSHYSPWIVAIDVQ